MATTVETQAATSSSSSLKKWLIRFIVIASLVWTAINWNGLSKIKDQLGSAGIVLGLIAASETCFIIGAILVATGGGREIYRGTGLNPVRWISATIRVREAYRKLIETAPDNALVRGGFHLNWVGAVGTGVFASLGIIFVLPYTAWGLLVLPLLDIAASFGWRSPIQKRLNIRDASVGKKGRVKLRVATINDVEELVAVDAERYKDEDGGYMTLATTSDPADMFRQRIINSRGYFWVAEVNGRVEGLLACQRTSLRPDDFVSWDQCTTNGTFAEHGDNNSDILYVAAVTTSRLGSRFDLFDRLLAFGIAGCLRTGVRMAFFSGRMPLYHKHTDMTPETYADMTRKDGKAYDPLIREFEGYGMKRVRVVHDGFKEDWQSCGNAVLFTYDIPMSGRWYSKLVGLLLKRMANHPRILAKVL